MRVGKTLKDGKGKPKELWVGCDGGNYKGNLRKRIHYYLGPTHDDADTKPEVFDWNTRVKELESADATNRRDPLLELWEGHFGEIIITADQENANAKRRKRDRENREKKKQKLSDETVVTAVDEKEKKKIDKMSPTDLFMLFQTIEKPFPESGYTRLPQIIKDYTKATALPTVDMLKKIRERGDAHAKKDNSQIWTDPEYLNWYKKFAPGEANDTVGSDEELEKEKTPEPKPRRGREAVEALDRSIAARKASRPDWFQAWLDEAEG